MENHNPTNSDVQNQLLKQENQRLTQENSMLNSKIKLLQQQMAQLLSQKFHSQSPNKEQVAPKKCSHGHNHDHSHGHNHGHSHSHGHGHGHNPHNDESSSEEQSPSKPTTAIQPPSKKTFLQKLFKTQQEIDFKYFRLPAKTVKAWKKEENIDLTKDKSCMLRKEYNLNEEDLREMKLNVKQFVSEKWQQVEWINLPECEIDDEGWRVMVENAEKSFPDLRVIGIRWNKIKTIKQGDLENFKNLRMIDLGLESQENNPLSQESRVVLKKFAEKHPNIKVD